MKQALRSDDIALAAVEYITPNSMRKIVRRPKVDVEAEELKVPFKDGSLSVRLWGKGERVLLVHGWAANQTDMFGFVPELMLHQLQAVTVDLPAHGESSGDRAGLDELGQGVLTVGNYLGPLKGVVAHSVGGAATQVAISNGLEVEKAVMLASPQDYELDIRQFAQRRGFSQEETEQLIDILKGLNVKTEIRSADVVPRFEVPALIVHSKDDPLIPVSTASDLSGYWKDSTLLEVDGLRHRGILKDHFVITETINFLMR